MNKHTWKYRLEEFKRLSTVYHEYKPKIKIIKPDGETKWLDISEEELNAIKVVLTEQVF